MSSPNAPPSYAPTSTTSYAPSNNNIDYHKEISRSSLAKSPLQKNVYDTLAEMFSIIMALEMVENSFVKDYITDREKYKSTTSRLINQYRMLLKGFQDDEAKKRILKTTFKKELNEELSNLPERLSEQFNLTAPTAIKRLQAGPDSNDLLRYAVEGSYHPSTSSLASHGKTSKSARLIAETTGNFITCMDALKLNYNTKEQLHPLLSELVLSLNELVSSEEELSFEEPKTLDFEGKSKLVNWLIKLNNLKDETLSREETDTFLNDLDIAYKGFYSSLE
ncbi:uncharacterized protein PRCAT00005331001 [Priceomyces carsonii]|uniref:uncharacterized protein n=1 Tax=Priceomyces carsonii TaxID=28549 RepID=UPI002EDB449D|nr:unnamed protein product [Priceomyces carsonii]